MAPPSYSLLEKKVRDIHKKKFHPGVFKFDVKTWTAGGVKLKTTGQTNVQNGKIVGGCKLKGDCSDYGLKYVEKWNTNNELTFEMFIEDYILPGLKTSFVSSFNTRSNEKTGTIKADYKHEYANLTAEVDLDYAHPQVRTAAVLGYKGWLAGYQMALDTPQAQFSDNSFCMGYHDGQRILIATVNNGSDFTGSYYHKLNPEVDVGLLLGWSSISGNPQASAAVKYTLSPDTSMKVKGSCDGEVGLSIRQRISQCLTLTLSGVLNVRNITAGGHEVGVQCILDQ